MPPALPIDCKKIARAALVSRMLAKGYDSKIVSPVQAIASWPRDAFGGDIEYRTLSTGRCDKLKSLDEVHHFGCRVAKVVNLHRQAGRSKPLRRPKDSTHYIGSYFIEADEVRSIRTEYFSLELLDTPRIQDDLEEHCDIVALPLFKFDDDDHLEQSSWTEILALLELCLKDPAPFISDEDNDVREYLEEIVLEALPKPDRA